jgi:OmcA/MtrC family decaheme c-type cytochrome
MRIPSSVFAVGRYAAGLILIAGSVALMSAPKNAGFSKHDKAFFADANTVSFVRPGLTITIVSAKVANDGTISVDYQLTDPKGMPLDLAGVQTPGAVSVSFLAAYIPQGQEQFSSYITRSSTATVGKKLTVTQAAGDSGGTTQTVNMGEYIYTFKAKAAGPNGAAFDPTVTHRIGMYGSRNLTEFDLGTNYASVTYDFVPNGAKVTTTRDVIRTASCNKCHDALAFHGGSRQGLDLCIMCHQPQTSDGGTGNTLDMKVFAHKIHMGSQLPSVQAGSPYQIVGYQNAISDWSTVVLPSDPRRCQFCHEQTTGAAQANIYATKPSSAACGACHDDVNFATGANHAGGPQASDNLCSTCHIPQGELDFDASIMGAHVVPDESSTLTGVNFILTKVTNGAAGKAPTVAFTVKDNKGNGIPLAQFGSLSLTMAGPTTDFGYTSFGSDTTSTPGYVTESIAKAATCSADGTCQYTFTHAVPAGSTGTFAIGIEGRIAVTLLPGTVQAQSVNMAGKNQVIYFSVDGSPVQSRRQVVALANCNGCHSKLEMHGNLRNNVEYCVLCHNPSNSDFTMRPSALVASDKTAPAQAINFALMVHKVHTGAQMWTNFGTDYRIVGYGGTGYSFGKAFATVPASIPNTGVRFPVMGPTGAVADTAKCDKCHVNNSELNFPIGLNNVTDPQGKLNPAPATTSACTACHQNTSALAHAVVNTDPKFGESCDVCHGSGAEFDVQKVHAGQ